ncbi:MAG: SIS domain-containing protein [Proteobacteria bacterium]|nr:SIS domain-containing protein [Pseudomonadota bacterium]
MILTDPDLQTVGSAFSDYSRRLNDALNAVDEENITCLCNSLLSAWKTGNQLFLCGNGGSAGNAVHIANDMIYGIDRKSGKGLRAHALAANTAILTCLANDEGYEEIFAKQLAVYANSGDILLVLSGSGNSANILRALEYADKNGIETYAILGYSGGKALQMTQHPIHFALDDMQISEDTQLIVMHYVMQWLADKASEVNS